MNKLALLLTLAALPLPAQDWARARVEKSPRHREWVTVKHDGRNVETFVVYPESSNKTAVVVIIHEIFGMTDWVEELADQVAEAGYIAIAPDLLSGMAPNGGRTPDFPQGGVGPAIGKLDPARITADLNAVADYGKKLPASTGKLFAAGFCWGGGQTFRFASNRADLAGAFVFYGPPPDKDAMARIQAPVYGFYGGNDARINSAIPATREAMTAAGKTYDPVIYEGAGHGFMRAGEAPEPNEANRKGRIDAWARWKRLLAGEKIAAVPSPALLVLNKADNELAVVDPASGQVVSRVPTGESPHELAVSSDGRLAFASNYGSRTPGNSISVIDLAAGTELRRVDLGSLGRPHGLDFAGGKLYFTAELAKVVARYDPVADKIDWLAGTGENGTHMVVVARKRNLIVTANIGSDTISIFDGSTPAWNQARIKVGKGPEAIDLSPDEREIWTSHRGDGAVSIIDVESGKVVERLDLGTKRSNRLKFTPDGKRVLISDDGGGELLVLDAGTRRVIKRLAIGQGPEGIQIVPDGSRAYVACSRDDKVAVVDLKTLEITGRLATGKNPDGMAWIAAP